MTKRKLRQLIEDMVRQHIIDEMSSTGGASGGMGPPEVPHAFAKDETDSNWKGKEFGEKSMPSPCKENGTKNINEVTVRTVASVAAHISFPISKEIKDFEQSVKNYGSSEFEKFIGTLKNKLSGRAAKFVAQKSSPAKSVTPKVYVSQITDIVGHIENGQYFVVLVSKDEKYFVSSRLKKNILLYGDEDSPSTDRVQNKPIPSQTSKNTVKI